MTGWDDVAAIALALPGTEAGTSYGQPAIKVTANGRTFVSRGSIDGSFVLHIDADTKEMLVETDPATFWQTPHYDGWPALLARYATEDTERVAAIIGQAYDQAAARPRVKPRRR